jgi:hypothetical protein
MHPRRRVWCPSSTASEVASSFAVVRSDDDVGSTAQRVPILAAARSSPCQKERTMMSYTRWTRVGIMVVPMTHEKSR